MGNKPESSKRMVYFDNAATTPLEPKVLQVMLPYFSSLYGNTSSIHMEGQLAESALEASRAAIAELVNGRPEHIIFTSGGTESDNLALRGLSRKAAKSGKKHLLISTVEHPAVSVTARSLVEHEGFEVEYLPVDSTGLVDPDEIRRRVRQTTGLVSVIAAQNEIGSVNPIREIASVCAEKDTLFHTDAVQFAAHFPIDIKEYPNTCISLGAHKFYGPKGVGALIVCQKEAFIPVQTGGGQEYGIRAGTHNTPLIVGMGKAYELAVTADQSKRDYLRILRDHLTESVLEGIPQVGLTGDPIKRLPNHASFIFEGLDANILLMLLDQAGFCCSSGSACKTGNPQVSDILQAIGTRDEWGIGSLRVSLGYQNTIDEIQEFLAVLPNAVATARLLSR